MSDDDTGSDSDGNDGTTVPDSAEVVIVGGGPAGCSAGVFCGRYGLETMIVDRGSSSLRQCGYLENFLGFPAGIDIGTFYELSHDHAREAGCAVVSDLVEQVNRTDGGLSVHTQDGRSVHTERVIAAARYDASYLDGLDDAMFEAHEFDGETHVTFDREYPDRDGRTPIEGLYIASPAGDPESQAIIAAGHGAAVARTLIADVRRERGLPDSLAPQYDWVRRAADRTGEWTERGRWREWFDDHVEGDSNVGDPTVDENAEQSLETLREREVDRRLDTYLTEDEIDRRTERGHERLTAYLDDSDGRSESPDGKSGRRRN